jgi:O-succinylbenzoic acid--CoA ligase
MPFLSLCTRQAQHLTALVADGNRILTYAELNHLASRLASALRAQGLRPGQRLGAWLDATPEYVALIHAAMHLGLTLVPLNRRLTVSERDWQMQSANCHDIITSDHPLWSRLPDSAPPLPRLPHNDTIATLMFTSGTTGRPKGALLTVGNHRAAVRASSLRLGTRPGERWLLCLPLYHIGGMSIPFRGCHDGLTIVLQKTFDADEVCHLLWQANIHLVSLVPTMLYRLMPCFEQRGVPPSLRLLLLGGAAAPPELLTRALHVGLPVALTYGLTESCAQAATALPADVRRKPGAVGNPCPAWICASSTKTDSPASLAQSARLFCADRPSCPAMTDSRP